MRISNRREFLRGASVVAASTVVSSRMAAKTQALTTSSNASLANAALAQQNTQPQKAPSSTRLRGLMVDAARVPERLEYYRRVIEFCADWELNALQFRVADDQGSALRFASVPNLVIHKNALTPEQMKDLAEYGKGHGVELIPEIESFGHTGFITRSAQYAHLLDSDAQGESEFTGMIPVHPETLQLFAKLYREVGEIFPSPYLHGGCDEVNWGGSALSRKALETKTRPEIWAEYLNSLAQLAEAQGKQFIVWGDFVLHKEPEILARLDKKIVIMDWNYRETNSAPLHDALAKVRANGSRGIGAPALINYQWGPRAGAEQLRNIDAFADAYFAPDASNSLGVILTNWVPSRYIQNSIWDGFAYGAVAFKEGTAAAQASALRRFVERHYGAEWSETWNEIFRTIYDAAPSVSARQKSPAMRLRLRVPWSSDEELSALVKSESSQSNPFTRLRTLLAQLEPSIHKNLSDFQAFALCVECLESVFWRGAVVAQAAGKTLQQEAASSLIQNIAARDKDLSERLSRDWDRGRPSDSAAKLEPLFGMQPKDQLLFTWGRASAYSASLALDPQRFFRILTANKPA
ncbi:MAG: family 20 glycosylhydrolase [Terracidiphilus sp.]